MIVTKSDIEGILIIEPTLHSDDRGYFFESFNERDFAEATGITTHFVQDNESRSAEGVVRGLHFQLPPFAQSKLVRVIEGEIFDIAVDIRRGSPTFGRYIAVRLSGKNHRQLYIPRGFAHGFVVVQGDAIVQYKCDNYYAPACERTIRWNDPKLNIDWGVDLQSAILSARDSAAKLLDECDTLFDYNIDYYA